MPFPRVAIVGRPNVGKSSLLNMIARERVAIVDDTPGVTRDRLSIVVDLDPTARGEPVRTIEVTDTGGYGVYVAEGRRFNDVGADLGSLTKDIEFQIAEAVRAADLVLFVVDAQAGVTPQDEALATMLRERVIGESRKGGAERTLEKPPEVRVVANKIDGTQWEPHGYEAASLGFGTPMLVSAKVKYMRRQFLDDLYDAVAALGIDDGIGEVPGEGDRYERGRKSRAVQDYSGMGEGGGEGVDGEAGEDDDGVRVDRRGEAWRTRVGGPRIAIIGKRNAGKSSLVNRLAGEPRVIVSEIAGTTRDAVDVRFTLDGRDFTAIDTAGLRRKKSFADRVEWFAFDRVQRAIKRADVVLLLIDATERLSQVDEQLAALVQESHKPVVLVLNKWDLVEGRKTPKGEPVSPEDFAEYVHKELKGLSFAPVSVVSAEHGTNVSDTVMLALELVEQASERVSTGVLNRLVRGILDARGPTSKLGTFTKVYFVSQIKTNPPTILLVVNRPELFTANYQRFLMNRFREELPFGEVPIRLVVRARKRAELHDLLTGEHARRKGSESAVEVDDQTGLELGDVLSDAELADLTDDAGDYFDED